MSSSELIVVWSIVTTLLSGCASPDQPRTDSRTSGRITLTETDAGKTFQLERGQRVVINLKSNVTTGYSWSRVDPADVPVLKQLGGASAPNPKGAIGSGDMQTWSFEGAETGQQELRFEYRRPWSGMPRPKRR